MTNSDRLRQFREASFTERSAPRKAGSSQRQRRRQPVPARRKGGARRGKQVDAEYREWMHATFGCLVAGRRADSPCGGVKTLHHVRRKVLADGTVERTGKIDRRTLLLCEFHHLHGNPDAIHTVTGPGEWEKRFAVNIEAEIRRYQGKFEEARRL